MIKFKLDYEEVEDTRMSTAKTKGSAERRINKRSPAKATKKNLPVARATRTKTTSPNVKQVFSGVVTRVKGGFNNALSKVRKPRKAAKKATKMELELAKKQRTRGIIGIGLLFVVVSIAYSTYMTNLFVDGSAMVIALAPQVIFAVTTFLIAFYKILK